MTHTHRVLAAALGCLAAGAAAATVLAAAPPALALAHAAPVGSTLRADWMANLAVRGSGPLVTRTGCGGALVAPDEVVTAAHCIALDAHSTVDLSTAEVHVGARTLSREPGLVRGIRAVDIDPGFRFYTSPVDPSPEADSAGHDVAVLHLDRPITSIRPLTVATRPVGAGVPAVVFGHGLTSPTSGVSDALRAGLLVTRPDAVCAAATPAVVDAQSVLCAHDPRRVGDPVVACTGDSGGPLVALHHGRPVLVGVFSFGMETAGEPCGIPGPQAFADVSRVGLPG